MFKIINKFKIKFSVEDNLKKLSSKYKIIYENNILNMY